MPQGGATHGRRRRLGARARRACAMRSSPFPEADGKGTNMLRRTTPRWLPSAVVFAVLLASWWFVTTFGLVNTHFLPSPQSALARLAAGRQYFAKALWFTLKEATLGCLAAAAIGIPVGYAIAKSRLFSRTIQPYLAASQAIPAVAIAPLLTIWIGHGLAPVVVLCAIMVTFPVVVNTAVGVKHIDPDLIGAARLDGASAFTMIRHVEVPLAAPAILSGLRTGFTLSITGAVVGEMVIGGKGLGILLTGAQNSADTTGMFATIILLASAAMLVYWLLTLAERRADYAIKD